MKRLIVIVASLALGAGLAQAAQAGGNLVPNPSFEETGSPFPCLGVCDWSAQDAVITRDTSTHYVGIASLRVVPIPLTNAGFAKSACFSASPGTYDFSFASAPSNTNVFSVYGSVIFFSDASCTTALAGPSLNNTQHTAIWDVERGPVTAPLGTQSASVALGAVCDTTCGAGANFDDVSLVQTSATAVRLRSFTATLSSKGALLRWRTASEIDTLGFNVYRGSHKLNRSLIAARGRANAGASYRFADRTARAGAPTRYRLQVVDLDGSRHWAATAAAR